jgi:16S rRNA (guanine966-N2)-methyltransferase
VRIVAGSLRGRQLRAPRGAAVRPTADRVRESLFAVLGDVEGDQVLDPFCGSGALGLEALSRGAAACLFADVAAPHLACARDNAQALGVADRCRFVRADVRRLLRDEASAGRVYDLVLLDPPYHALPRLLTGLRELLPPITADGGRVVLEAPLGASPALFAAPADVRRYGTTELHLYTP